MRYETSAWKTNHFRFCRNNVIIAAVEMLCIEYVPGPGVIFVVNYTRTHIWFDSCAHFSHTGCPKSYVRPTFSSFISYKHSLIIRALAKHRGRKLLFAGNDEKLSKPFQNYCRRGNKTYHWWCCCHSIPNAIVWSAMYDTNNELVGVIGIFVKFNYIKLVID